MTRNRWIVSRARACAPRLRLYCFPYAGRGASMYASWASTLGADVEICPVQLPGREDRLNEPPARRMEIVAEGFLASVRHELGTPFAFFGHSMGGLVAYEVARRLQTMGARGPEVLFISASQPPSKRDKGRGVHRLSDERFLAEVRSWNGTPEAVLSDPALVQLLLPVLRADLELLHNYEVAVAEENRLAAPIIAFGGTRDHGLPGAELARWRDFTRQRFALHMIEGDHFFVNGSGRLLRQTIGAELLQASPAAA